MYMLYQIVVKNSANAIIYNDIIKAKNATDALYEFVSNLSNTFESGDTITINEYDNEFGGVINE